MAGEVGENRDAGGLGELQELIGDPRLEGAEAGHDRRTLGGGEDVERPRQGLGRGPGSLAQQDRVGDVEAVLLDPGVQHIGRQVQQHRPGGTGCRNPDGVGDQPGDVVDVGDPVRPLGDRPGDRGLVDARLQGVGLRVAGRGRAGEIEHRRAVEEGVGDGGDDIGEAGAGGHHGHAEPASRAGVTLGRMAGRHLVTHVEYWDAVIQARLEDALQVGAVQAEQPFDTGLHQCANQELAAGHRRHLILPPALVAGPAAPD